MITKTETITVSRDDPLAKKCEEALTRENGWIKKDYSNVITFTRESWIGQEQKCDILQE